jgi:hypothetical protein
MPGSERRGVEQEESLRLEPVPCIELASSNPDSGKAEGDDSKGPPELERQHPKTTNHTDEAVEGPPEETHSTIAIWVRGHARRIDTGPFPQRECGDHTEAEEPRPNENRRISEDAYSGEEQEQTELFHQTGHR